MGEEPHKIKLKQCQVWQVLVEGGRTVQFPANGNEASSRVKQHNTQWFILLHSSHQPGWSFPFQNNSIQGRTVLHYLSFIVHATTDTLHHFHFPAVSLNAWIPTSAWQAEPCQKLPKPVYEASKLRIQALGFNAANAHQPQPCTSEKQPLLAGLNILTRGTLTSSTSTKSHTAPAWSLSQLMVCFDQDL